MRVLVPVLLVALLAAACSGGGSTTRDAQTAVEITLWPEGQGKGATKTANLVCDPQAGNLPDIAAACATLASAEGRAALDAPSLDQLCTELYGGPAEARIMGTVDGEVVDAHLSRVNGCEIQRWQALAALLPAYQPV
ncbi:MAG: SSI family serine proteinase inhibitor [Thermoleophilia bacterium]